jgi:hypothetical protein
MGGGCVSAQPLLPGFPKPSVVRATEDGYFEFLLDGEVVYDLKANDAGHALRWIEHMAQKSWVTKTHLEQFASLVATRFGAAY